MDETPEPVVSSGDLPAAAPADRSPSGSTAVDRLVPGLWLVTAAVLAGAPFLPFFEYGFKNADGEVRDEYDVNGWGADGGMEFVFGHAPRWGVLLVPLAAALLVAAVTGYRRRSGGWPDRIGWLVTAMTVAVTGLLVIDLESQYSANSDQPATRDTSLGVGGWMVLAAGGLAVVAFVVGARRWRSAWTAPPPAWVRLGLWPATAVAFVVAPFLTWIDFELRATVPEAPAGERDVVQRLSSDGWGMSELTGEGEALGHLPRFGILLAVLAAALLVGAAGAWLWRSAVWPALAGTGAAAMAAGVALALGLFMEAKLSQDGRQGEITTEVTIGPGAWLALAAGLLAVVAAGVSLAGRLRPPPR